MLRSVNKFLNCYLRKCIEIGLEIFGLTEIASILRLGQVLTNENQKTLPPLNKILIANTLEENEQVFISRLFLVFFCTCFPCCDLGQGLLICAEGNQNLAGIFQSWSGNPKIKKIKRQSIYYFVLNSKYTVHCMLKELTEKATQIKTKINHLEKLKKKFGRKFKRLKKN